MVKGRVVTSRVISGKDKGKVTTRTISGSVKSKSHSAERFTVTSRVPVGGGQREYIGAGGKTFSTEDAARKSQSRGRSWTRDQRVADQLATSKAAAEKRAKEQERKMAEAKAKLEAQKKADLKAKRERDLKKAKEELRLKKILARKLAKKKAGENREQREARRRANLKLANAQLKANQERNKLNETIAQDIIIQAENTGRVTRAMRQEINKLGYSDTVLIKVQEGKLIGDSILKKVEKTGQITPAQREKFKELGLDTRQLAIAALKKGEAKRITTKQAQYDNYVNKRNKLTKNFYKARDILQSNANPQAKKLAQKMLLDSEKELNSMRKTKLGKEIEPLIEEGEIKAEVKRLKDLKTFRKEEAKLTKAIRNDMFKTINSVQNKINTGQSITPKDYKVFQKQFDKGISLIDITRGLSVQKKETVKELKDFYDDIKSIDIKGTLNREKLPSIITKGVKSVGSGTLEFSKELVLPVKIAYNYGTSLVDRAVKERTKSINILAKDILRLNKGVISARQFVQQHPYKAGVIVGAIAKEVGKSYIKSFKKDPVKALTKAVLNLYGIRTIFKLFKNTTIARILKEAEFVGKQPKKIKPFVRAILKAGRFQEKLNPSKLKGIKKINFNEVLELNATEAKALKKVLQETDSFVFGSLPARTLSGGRTKLPKDVDLATRNVKEFLEKFKKNLPANIRSKYIIKGEKLYNPQGVGILDIKGFDRLRPNQSIFGKGQLPINKAIEKKGFAIRIKEALTGKKIKGKIVLETQALTVPTQKLVKVEGIKIVGFGEQTQRKALGTLQVILEDGKRRAKDPAAFIEALELQLKALKGDIAKTSILNPLKFSKKFTAKQLDDALKILKSKKFANFLNSRVPGLTKEFPIFKKIPKLDKVKLNKRIAAKLKKIKTQFKKVGVLDTKKKPSKVPKKKPIKKPSKKTPTKKKPSKIPKSKIPTSRIPRSKIPTSRIPKSRIPKSKIPTSKIPTSKIPTSKIPKSKIPKSRIPKAPPTKTPVVKPPKRILLPRLSFDNKNLKNKVALFIGKYRERQNPRKPFNKRTNKVVVKTLRIKDTKNRALKRVSDLADNKAIRSIDIKLVSITTTKKKDIGTPAVMSKFRTTKSKLKDRLNLVEKSKHTLDKKTERRELASLKKKKKGTTKKKAKVVRKKKRKL